MKAAVLYEPNTPLKVEDDMNDTARPVFAVLGSGHGGLAMAGHLSLMGFEVRLYNRTPERIEPIRRNGTIEVIARDGEDIPHGHASIPVATSDMGEAVRGANVVMVVVPANAHSWLAEEMAQIAETSDMFLQEVEAILKWTFAVNNAVSEGSSMYLTTLSMEVPTSSSLGSQILFEQREKICPKSSE